MGEKRLNSCLFSVGEMWVNLQSDRTHLLCTSLQQIPFALQWLSIPGLKGVPGVVLSRVPWLWVALVGVLGTDLRVDPIDLLEG